MLTTEERNRRILASMQSVMPSVTDFSHDTGLPTKPAGHAFGIKTATRIVRSYRASYRHGSENVEPNEVIEVLQDAGVKRWVLMGLYGYVGYLPQPRATQDVDVLIAGGELQSATDAILNHWPQLTTKVLDVVTRFIDPNEISVTGEAQQVIDLMLPSSQCYEAILDTYCQIDEETGHRIPTVEAACASKFSAVVSPYRQFERKLQDAVDLRQIMVANASVLDRQILSALGDLIYPGGGVELIEYLNLAIAKKPFPV